VDHLDTRTQLINFICLHARPAVKRACHTGVVEVLGGFSQVSPPDTRPGWIVSVTSVYGRTWFVVVSPHASEPTYTVGYTSRVPFKFWVCCTADERAMMGDAYSIFDGDNPERATLLRDAARGLLT